MAKKYFWLKLKDDFFQQRAIKKLRKLAGGDTFTIIYLKLQLLSLKDEGRLYYEGVEDQFFKEMALAIDEDESNVQFTIIFLEKNNLLEKIVEDEYFLPTVISNIGKEGSSAERMRRLRENKKEKASLSDTSVTRSDTLVTFSDTEIDREIDEEIEKDKEIDNKDLSTINFKDDFLRLKDIIAKATGLDLMRVESVIKPVAYREVDLNLLIAKISESQFLSGKLERKPSINNFTVKIMIDKIFADAYKDKPNKTKKAGKSKAERELELLSGEVV